LIAGAIERKRTDKRLDFLQRQVNMLRSNERARAARELRDNAMAEDADDD
jgi:signal transduction histidine kinase